MDFLDDLSFPEKMLCLRATQQHVPINGVLELTPLCNMNCEMCYVKLTADELKHQGRLRTLDEWLSIAKDMKNAGTVFLLLTGGEPLLYPNFKELYTELRKMGMILTINTNGTLIDEEWAVFFKENKPRRINITLYGTDEAYYEDVCHYRDGFKNALRGIELLSKYGVDVKINGSLMSKNKNNALMIQNLAKEMGIFCKIDTYMYPENRERSTAFQEEARMLPEEAAFWKIRLMKNEMTPEAFANMAQLTVDKLSQPITDADAADCKVGCRAGKSAFVIHWNGKMSPCLFLKEPSCSVIEKGFMESWRYIVDAVDQIRLSIECASCKYQSVCQTCAACAKAECGSFDGTPKYMCRYTKESMRLLKEYTEQKY